MHLDTEEDQDRDTNPKNIIEDIEDDAKEDHAAHSKLKKCHFHGTMHRGIDKNIFLQKFHQSLCGC